MTSIVQLENLISGVHHTKLFEVDRGGWSRFLLSYFPIRSVYILSSKSCYPEHIIMISMNWRELTHRALLGTGCIANVRVLMVVLFQEGSQLAGEVNKVPLPYEEPPG